MKQQFKEHFETRLFNALMAFVLFGIMAIGFDYGTDERFSSMSLLYDFLYSLILGILIYVVPSRPVTDKKVLQRHAEIAEMIGFILIGLLLFIAVIVFMLTHNK